MKKELFDKLCSIPDENAEWLAAIADTSLEHMRYMQANPETTPDDEGLLTLEQGFLYCYGLCLKNGLFNKTKEELN